MYKIQRVLFVLFCTVVFYSLGAHAEAVVDQKAPALTVPLLNGQVFTLAEEKGRYVLVSFWATWCPPCREEMPHLEALYNRHHISGLDVIGVSIDKNNRRDDVVRVMKGFHFPAAMLTDATSNEFGQPPELPLVYLIGRDGKIKAELSEATTPFSEEIVETYLTDRPKKKSADGVPEVPSIKR